MTKVQKDVMPVFCLHDELIAQEFFIICPKYSTPIASSAILLEVPHPFINLQLIYS